MSIKITKRQPKRKHLSYDIAVTKSEAMRKAKTLAKRECEVVVWDYGKDRVKTTRGRSIKYAILWITENPKCSKK